jgi:hypothetical protein
MPDFKELLAPACRGPKSAKRSDLVRIHRHGDRAPDHPRSGRNLCSSTYSQVGDGFLRKFLDGANFAANLRFLLPISVLAQKLNSEASRTPMPRTTARFERPACR